MRGPRLLETATWEFQRITALIFCKATMRRKGLVVGSYQRRQVVYRKLLFVVDGSGFDVPESPRTRVAPLLHKVL